MSSALPFPALALALGLCVGSYAGTAAMRAARKEPSLAGRSHCDACGKSLGWAETVPVLSFVALGGRCVACRAPISRFHLVCELAVGAAALFGWMALPWR
jgi:leader peptidase (prepilin peptidase)/N-methyltransferase